MKAMIPQKKRFAGFSLVELAIALLIMSILMSAGLSLATIKREAAQREVTQKNQEAIKQALISYLGKNQRLPCPADPAVVPITGAEGRSTTTPPCAKYSGVVPYAELGLDRTAALDGWENFITYVVSPPISSNPTPPPTTAPSPQWTTAWLYKYSLPCTANTCTSNPTPANPNLLGAGPYAFWPSSSTGGITIRDTLADVANQIADPTKATGAVVALISYGKNGYGAFNIKGGTNSAPPAANSDETYNTTPYSVALQPIVIKRDTTDSATATGGPFDDIVMIITSNDLTGPLFTNGTLQSSAQTALSQGNDFVMGSILSQKFSCPGAATYPVCSFANYFYVIPPSISTTSFPVSVAAWGVSYTTTKSYIDVNGVSPTTPPLTAYILTAGDGAQLVVTSQTVEGSLLHAGQN